MRKFLCSGTWVIVACLQDETNAPYQGIQRLQFGPILPCKCLLRLYFCVPHVRAHSHTSYLHPHTFGLCLP